MKALVLWGLKEPLSYEEFPEPILTNDEVIVELKSAAFNRRDYWITQGMYPGIIYPTILGSDGAGVVNGREVIIYPASDWGAEPAAQANSFKILGLPDHGCFAERVAVSERNLFPKPAHLSWHQAAALPLAGLTAYRALFSRAALKKDDRVLISGVGGGVGLLAMQFAIANGNEVYVTSGSAEKIKKAKGMGAVGGAIYKEEGWHKNLRKESGGFDVIIDGAAGKTFLNLIDLLNPGGRICFYGGTTGKIPPLNPQKIFWKQLSVLGSTMGTKKEFDQMVDFVELHDVVPIVDEVFELKNGNQALEKMANHRQFGKLVLNI